MDAAKLLALYEQLTEDPGEFGGWPDMRIVRELQGRIQAFGTSAQAFVPMAEQTGSVGHAAAVAGAVAPLAGNPILMAEVQKEWDKVGKGKP